MKTTASFNRYRSHLFRAIAIACMLYGITLIADTAAAAMLLQVD